MVTMSRADSTIANAAGPFHLPVVPGVSVYVYQGNNDLLHDHNDKFGQRYAFDFTVGQQNFTITAAQGGQVIGENDQSDIQCDQLNHESAPHVTDLQHCWAHANFVLIADNDGTTAQLYMHLLPGSVLVHDGDTVTQGQPIAKAGTTGWSTGIHLHFQVEPAPTPQSDPYTGWWWRPTVPVTFDDPAVLAHDSDGIPKEGKTYTEGGSTGVSATPTPTTIASATPTTLADAMQPFVGDWASEGVALVINADGTGSLRGRTYRWCTDSPPPCDSDNNGDIVGGLDSNLLFTQVSGPTAYGTIVSGTDDPGQNYIAVGGSISVTLGQNNTLSVSDGRIMCTAAVYMQTASCP
jgi:hypothetical protein